MQGYCESTTKRPLGGDVTIGAMSKTLLAGHGFAGDGMLHVDQILQPTT